MTSRRPSSRLLRPRGGQPGALLALDGRTEETISADFSAILSFSHSGTTENLCETLA